jgi:hypothetical protein
VRYYRADRGCVEENRNRGYLWLPDLLMDINVGGAVSFFEYLRVTDSRTLVVVACSSAGVPTIGRVQCLSMRNLKDYPK